MVYVESTVSYTYLLFTYAYFYFHHVYGFRGGEFVFDIFFVIIANLKGAGQIVCKLGYFLILSYNLLFQIKYARLTLQFSPKSRLGSWSF